MPWLVILWMPLGRRRWWIVRMIAAGAIMVWAVNTTVSGLSIHTVGIILIVIGAVGLVLSIIFWSSWGGFSGANTRREGSSTTVVER